MKQNIKIFFIITLLFINITVYAETPSSQAVLKEWVSTLKLSSIDENVIYRYTATSTTQFPSIINDTGKNVLVYLKERDGTYDQDVYPMKTLESQAISASDNEYLKDEAFNIYYKPISNTELLNFVSQTDVIKLSSYNNGDELNYQFEKYIYNDTNKDIVLTIKDTFTGGNPITKTEKIPKDTIYGFDWMIDSVIVGEQVEIPENNTGGTLPINPNPEEQKQPTNNKDNEKNPNTGINISLTIIIGTVLLALVMFTISEKNKVFKKI